MARKTAAADDIPAAAQVAESATSTPCPTDPDWSDWLMDQLADNEKNAEGYPFHHGLRRLVARHLGPIVDSTIHTIQAPCEANGFHAIVECEITIAHQLYGRDVRVREPGEVYAGGIENTNAPFDNIGDMRFGRFPEQVAATRAKSRCYREALGLKKATADEITSAPVVSNAPSERMITGAQVLSIKKLCRDCGIDVGRLLKNSSCDADDLAELTFDQGPRLMKRLNQFFQDPQSIPDKIRVNPKKADQAVPQENE